MLFYLCFFFRGACALSSLRGCVLIVLEGRNWHSDYAHITLRDQTNNLTSLALTVLTSLLMGITPLSNGAATADAALENLVAIWKGVRD